MNTLLDKWEKFKGGFPSEIPQDILDTLKHTFYAGALGYIELESEIDNDTSISGDASIAIINGVLDEITSTLGMTPVD